MTSHYRPSQVSNQLYPCLYIDFQTVVHQTRGGSRVWKGRGGDFVEKVKNQKKKKKRKQYYEIIIIPIHTDCLTCRISIFA